MKVKWINKPWGISPLVNGRWAIVFGDSNQVAISGSYRNRRAAKKEITHYIIKGLAIGSFHGACARRPF